MKLSSLTLALIASALLVAPSATQAAVSSGRLVKTQDQAAVYYSFDGFSRYVFPNQRIYQSWYSSFDNVETISATDLASMRIGGAVLYKPGSLIKITTDPKVYLVTNLGFLRWIPTEDIARSLFGANWANRVEDVDDAFFIAYRVAQPLTSADANLATLQAGWHTDSIATNQGLYGIADPGPVIPPAPTTTVPTATGPDIILRSSAIGGVRVNQDTLVTVYADQTIPSTIDIRVNGFAVQTCRSQATCTHTFAHPFYSPLTSYAVSAEATYADGAKKTQTLTLPVLDIPAGALTLTPTNSESRTPANIDFRAQWSDSTSRPYRLAIYLDGQERKSCFNALECTFSYGISESVGATLEAYAIAESTAGQLSRSATSTVTIVSNPKPLITTTVNTPVVYLGESASIGVQASDENGISFIEIYESDALVMRCERPSCSYVSTPITAKRPLRYRVVAQDLLGARQTIDLEPMLTLSVAE